MKHTVISSIREKGREKEDLSSPSNPPLTKIRELSAGKSEFSLSLFSPILFPSIFSKCKPFSLDLPQRNGLAKGYRISLFLNGKENERDTRKMNKLSLLRIWYMLRAFVFSLISQGLNLFYLTLTRLLCHFKRDRRVFRGKRESLTTTLVWLVKYFNSSTSEFNNKGKMSSRLSQFRKQ